ncbi:unnamed protein product [Brachionus calyciflorus]|uniref:EGF-like domain-containing protein n=1 Tax=Brachionus calyciflorus TaxID=104777 RepID=A0A813M6F6_9BILA|nr:unnamed protein product [Brachionus calyciflorus]
MKKLYLNVFVFICFALFTNCLFINRNNTDLESSKVLNTTIRNESLKYQKKISRKKRAFDFTGGLAMGFGAYDYYNYYGDLVSDYSYDYYDWICSETSCQLCDILTSECCDPDVDVNCFLPDTCFNNPCLSGGTCITARTVDDRPDFTCVCLPGLTGKYCQLVNDYFLGAERLAMALLNPPAVLGGLSGVGLNIPAGQGAPPIPPALAVLNEMQRRLGPVPPPMPPGAPGAPGVPKSPGDPGNPDSSSSSAITPNGSPELGRSEQQGQRYNYQGQKNGANSNYRAYLQTTPYNVLQNGNDEYSISSTPTPNYQYNRQNSGMKILGAKRIVCPDGKIFNSEKKECTDFTLRQKKEETE